MDTIITILNAHTLMCLRFTTTIINDTHQQQQQTEAAATENRKKKSNLTRFTLESATTTKTRENSGIPGATHE